MLSIQLVISKVILQKETKYILSVFRI